MSVTFTQTWRLTTGIVATVDKGFALLTQRH